MTAPVGSPPARESVACTIEPVLDESDVSATQNFIGVGSAALRGVVGKGHGVQIVILRRIERKTRCSMNAYARRIRPEESSRFAFSPSLLLTQCSCRSRGQHANEARQLILVNLMTANCGVIVPATTRKELRRIKSHRWVGVKIPEKRIRRSRDCSYSTKCPTEISLN